MSCGAITPSRTREAKRATCSSVSRERDPGPGMIFAEDSIAVALFFRMPPFSHPGVSWPPRQHPRAFARFPSPPLFPVRAMGASDFQRLRVPAAPADITLPGPMFYGEYRNLKCGLTFPLPCRGQWLLPSRPRVPPARPVPDRIHPPPVDLLGRSLERLIVVPAGRIVAANVLEEDLTVRSRAARARLPRKGRVAACRPALELARDAVGVAETAPAHASSLSTPSRVPSSPKSASTRPPSISTVLATEPAGILATRRR